MPRARWTKEPPFISGANRKTSGISVMKPFSGGQLLDAALSPFSQELTAYQCMQYALDRPGVLTVLPGIGSLEQLDSLLKFFDAPEEEKDYSVIGSFKPADAARQMRILQPLQALPGRHRYRPGE